VRKTPGIRADKGRERPPAKGKWGIWLKGPGAFASVRLKNTIYWVFAVSGKFPNLAP